MTPPVTPITPVLLQELKGNIRVFCRVRPISDAERSSAQHDSDMALDFPHSSDPLSAGGATKP